MKPMNMGRGLDLLFPGKGTRIHCLRTMDRTCVLFLKEFRDLTCFHRRISIKNRHYRMAFFTNKRGEGLNSWIRFLSTKEGAEAAGVFAGQLGGCRALTRRGTKEATIGCRWWQMIYAILVSLPFAPSVLLEWKKGIQERSTRYADLLEQAQFILRQIERDRTSTLNRILYQNEALVCEAEAETKEPCLRSVGMGWVRDQPNGRYYMCTYREGSIGHYFVLEKQGRAWYILSSYGSEWIRTPFRLSRVSAEEIEGFLSSTNMTTDEERRYVEEFFSRYFLEGGLPQRYSEDESESLQGRVIPAPIGIQQEWKIVGRTGFQVGRIEGMEEAIRDLARSEGGCRKGLTRRRKRNVRGRSRRGVQTRGRK